MSILMYTCTKCGKQGAIEDAAKFQMDDDRFALCQKHYTEMLHMIAEWLKIPEGKNVYIVCTEWKSMDNAQTFGAVESVFENEKDAEAMCGGRDDRYYEALLLNDNPDGKEEEKNDV